MKTTLKIALVIVLILGGIFALGPRPEINDMMTFDENLIGENIETYLKTSEAKVPNLKEGTEKEIIWADPTAKSQTEISVIYAHGFSATKHETRPLADMVATALDANLYYMRFTGHGSDGDAMGEATMQDWANDYAEAMAIAERLGKKIIIIATSNGGTMTTWALTKPELSKNVIGTILLSPNYELQGISTALANIPWAETILPFLGGQNRSWEPINEEHGKWWTTSYPSKSIFPMTSYLALLKEIDKSKITTPAFFIYSDNDTVIVPSEIDKVISEWGGPTKALKIDSKLDPYNHVLAGDILSPENTKPLSEKIIAWAEAL